MAKDLVAASVLITQALAAAHTALYGIIALANLLAEELEGFEQGSRLGQPAGTPFGSAKRKKQREVADPNVGEKQPRKKRKQKQQNSPAGISGATAAGGAAAISTPPAETSDSGPHCQPTSKERPRPRQSLADQQVATLGC